MENLAHVLFSQETTVRSRTVTQTLDHKMSMVCLVCTAKSTFQTLRKVMESTFAKNAMNKRDVDNVGGCQCKSVIW